MTTDSINHTAIYKHACTLPGFNEEAFKRMFRTGPSRDKNLQSREHDEVISRAIKAMGLKLQFFTNESKKKGVTRFVKIYGNYSLEEERAK
ncbi:MAG: hypothetical protein WD512_14580, partial [Candidatus Paceibacterota bacterium]